MKLLLASSVVAVMVGSPVFAADLPVGTFSPVAPVIVAQAFTWTGTYAGVNGGYGWGVGSLGKVAPGKDAVGSVAAWTGEDRDFARWSDKRAKSFVGGGQVGYNYQIGSFVMGLEADLNYANLEAKRSGENPSAQILPGLRYGKNIRARANLQWFGTIRPRIGVVIADRMLAYATGGIAYGAVKTNMRYDNIVNGATDGSLSGKHTTTRAGWTIGGGLEYAISDNVSLKGEYNYIDLGSEVHRLRPNADSKSFVTVKDDMRFHVVRVGLNYRY